MPLCSPTNLRIEFCRPQLVFSINLWNEWCVSWAITILDSVYVNVGMLYSVNFSIYQCLSEIKKVWNSKFASFYSNTYELTIFRRSEFGMVHRKEFKIFRPSQHLFSQTRYKRAEDNFTSCCAVLDTSQVWQCIGTHAVFECFFAECSWLPEKNANCTLKLTI